MAGAAPGGGGGGPPPLPPPLILPAPLGPAPAAPAVPAGYQHVAYAPVPLNPHPIVIPSMAGSLFLAPNLPTFGLQQLLPITTFPTKTVQLPTKRSKHI